MPCRGVNQATLCGGCYPFPEQGTFEYLALDPCFRSELRKDKKNEQRKHKRHSTDPNFRPLEATGYHREGRVTLLRGSEDIEERTKQE